MFLTKQQVGFVLFVAREERREGENLERFYSEGMNDISLSRNDQQQPGSFLACN